MRYEVRIRVPRAGGMREWSAVRGAFERGLAGQEGPGLVRPRIETETRRGRDYVAVTVAMTVRSPDPARALAAAWDGLLQAVGEDEAGWDMASASAEVRPEP